MDSADYTVPPTSSPYEILMTLDKEVRGVDGHSERIKLNRLGIVRGAEIMKKRKIITGAQRNQIELIAEEAPIALFKPFLCVIPTATVRPYCTEVDISDRASLLSQEYIAADLPTSAFDIISLG